jgi:hypothetical protein
LKTPTWGETEEFCRKDGWRELRQSGHRFFQKILADGSVLETHTSFSSTKTMSPGRFRAILRDQLRVTEEQFWQVLQTGRPAQRPAPAPVAQQTEHPAWVVRVLKQELHKTEEEIARLGRDEAAQLVQAYWSRERRG